MPDWLKQNIPVIALFILGLYVSLQTLETKFAYQEARSQERYRLLVDIQKSTAAVTLQLAELSSSFSGLSLRVQKLESYVPDRITNVEKDVISLKKDINMLNYQVKEGQ